MEANNGNRGAGEPIMQQPKIITIQPDSINIAEQVVASSLPQQILPIPGSTLLPHNHRNLFSTTLGPAGSRVIPIGSFAANTNAGFVNRIQQQNVPTTATVILPPVATSMRAILPHNLLDGNSSVFQQKSQSRGAYGIFTSPAVPVLPQNTSVRNQGFISINPGRVLLIPSNSTTRPTTSSLSNVITSKSYSSAASVTQSVFSVQNSNSLPIPQCASSGIEITGVSNAVMDKRTNPPCNSAMNERSNTSNMVNKANIEEVTIAVIEGNSNKRFYCNYCNFMAREMEKVISHYLDNHVRRCAIGDCRFNCRTYFEKVQHIRNVHTDKISDVESYQSMVVQRKHTDGRSSMVEHVLQEIPNTSEVVQNRNEGNTYHCTVEDCSLTFASLSLFQCHSLSSHNVFTKQANLKNFVKNFDLSKDKSESCMQWILKHGEPLLDVYNFCYYCAEQRSFSTWLLLAFHTLVSHNAFINTEGKGMKLKKEESLKCLQMIKQAGRSELSSKAIDEYVTALLQGKETMMGTASETVEQNVQSKNNSGSDDSVMKNIPSKHMVKCFYCETKSAKLDQILSHITTAHPGKPIKVKRTVKQQEKAAQDKSAVSSPKTGNNDNDKTDKADHDKEADWICHYCDYKSVSVPEVVCHIQCNHRGSKVIISQKGDEGEAPQSNTAQHNGEQYNSARSDERNVTSSVCSVGGSSVSGLLEVKSEPPDDIESLQAYSIASDDVHSESPALGSVQIKRENLEGETESNNASVAGRSSEVDSLSSVQVNSTFYEQKKASCGHYMPSFDSHTMCKPCRIESSKDCKEQGPMCDECRDWSPELWQFIQSAYPSDEEILRTGQIYKSSPSTDQSLKRKLIQAKSVESKRPRLEKSGSQNIYAEPAVKYLNRLPNDLKQNKEEMYSVNAKTHSASCNLCSYNSSGSRAKELVIHHVRNHIALWGCPYCILKSPKKSHVAKHIKAKHPDREYKIICRKPLKYWTTLKKRDKVTVEAEKQKVTVEAEKQSTIASEKLQSSGGRRYSYDSRTHTAKCSFCSFSMKGVNAVKNIQRHLQTHGDYKCDVCGKIYRSMFNLRSHVFNVHGNKTAPIQNKNIKQVGKRQKILLKLGAHKCPYCAFSSNFKAAVSTHVRFKHHHKQRKASSSVVKVFPGGRNKCPQCPFSTSALAGLKSHIKYKHQEIKANAIQVEITDKSSRVAVTAKLHTQASQHRYQCPHCLFSALAGTGLASHIRSNHPGSNIDDGKRYTFDRQKKEASCKSCSFKCSGSIALVKILSHIRKLHLLTDFIGHRCPYCSFVSKTKRNVARHLRTRHKSKPFRIIPINVDEEQKQENKNSTPVHEQLFGERRRRIVIRGGLLSACSRCDFEATGPLSGSEVTIHFAKQHLTEPERVFGCSICKYSSFCRNSVIRHSKKTHQKKAKAILRKIIPVNNMEKDAENGEAIESLQYSYLPDSKVASCLLCTYQSTGQSAKRIISEHIAEIHNDSSSKDVKQELSASTEALKLVSKGLDGIDIVELKKLPADLKVDESAYFKKDSSKYKCLKCSKQISSLGVMRDHMLFHTGGKKWGCPYCDFKCNNRNDTILHLEKHHQGKPKKLIRRRPFERPFGIHNLKPTTSAESVQKEEPVLKSTKSLTPSIEKKSNHWSPDNAEVVELDYIPDDFKIDEKEYYTFVKRRKLYKCKHCTYNHATRVYMERHILIHTGGKIWGCPYCKEKRNKRYLITKHVSCQHPDKALTIIRRKPYGIANRSMVTTDSKEGDQAKTTLQTPKTKIQTPKKKIQTPSKLETPQKPSPLLFKKIDRQTALKLEKLERIVKSAKIGWQCVYCSRSSLIRTEIITHMAFVHREREQTFPKQIQHSKPSLEEMALKKAFVYLVKTDTSEVSISSQLKMNLPSIDAEIDSMLTELDSVEKVDSSKVHSNLSKFFCVNLPHIDDVMGYRGVLRKSYKQKPLVPYFFENRFLCKKQKCEKMFDELTEAKSHILSHGGDIVKQYGDFQYLRATDVLARYRKDNATLYLCPNPSCVFFSKMWKHYCEHNECSSNWSVIWGDLWPGEEHEISSVQIREIAIPTTDKLSLDSEANTPISSSQNHPFMNAGFKENLVDNSNFQKDSPINANLPVEEVNVNDESDFFIIEENSSISSVEDLQGIVNSLDQMIDEEMENEAGHSEVDSRGELGKNDQITANDSVEEEVSKIMDDVLIGGNTTNSETLKDHANGFNNSVHSFEMDCAETSETTGIIDNIGKNVSLCIMSNMEDVDGGNHSEKTNSVKISAGNFAENETLLNSTAHNTINNQQEMKESVSSQKNDQQEMQESVSNHNNDQQDSVSNHSNDQQEMLDSVSNHSNDQQEIQDSVSNHSNDQQEMQKSVSNHNNDQQEMQDSVSNHSNDQQEMQKSVSNHNNDQQEMQDSVSNHSNDQQEMQKSVSNHNNDQQEMQDSVNHNNDQQEMQDSVSNHNNDQQEMQESVSNHNNGLQEMQESVSNHNKD